MRFVCFLNFNIERPYSTHMRNHPVVRWCGCWSQIIQFSDKRVVRIFYFGTYTIFIYLCITCIYIPISVSPVYGQILYLAEQYVCATAMIKLPFERDYLLYFELKWILLVLFIWKFITNIIEFFSNIVWSKSKNIQLSYRYSPWHP